MEKKEILLIDDDIELCSEMAEFLKSYGYDIENTSSSLEGNTIIDTCAFDIIILDYKMPGLTGIDLLKKIKKIHPDTAVFFISGITSLEKLLAGENMLEHVDAIINKPFDDKILLDKIKAVLLH